MKASELINKLKNVISLHGDLEVCGGFMSDDAPISKVTIIESDGCEVADVRDEVTGVYLE